MKVLYTPYMCKCLPEERELKHFNKRQDQCNYCSYFEDNTLGLNVLTFQSTAKRSTLETTDQIPYKENYPQVIFLLSILRLDITSYHVLSDSVTKVQHVFLISC